MNKDILEMDRRGIIPFNNETESDFLKRGEATLEFSEIYKLPWQKLYHGYITPWDIFSLIEEKTGTDLDWLPVRCEKGEDNGKGKLEILGRAVFVSICDKFYLPCAVVYNDYSKETIAHEIIEAVRNLQPSFRMRHYITNGVGSFLKTAALEQVIAEYLCDELNAEYATMMVEQYASKKNFPSRWIYSRLKLKRFLSSFQDIRSCFDNGNYIMLRLSVPEILGLGEAIRNGDAKGYMEKQRGLKWDIIRYNARMR
jgi:hypothetical protein